MPRWWCSEAVKGIVGCMTIPTTFWDNKVFISLISVGVGWALAQSTALARDFYVSLKLKHALLKELEDIREQLERVAMAYRRNLQFYALRGIENSAPNGVPNLFFKQYYKEVFYRLNREQRLSYQLIHATIDRLNADNEDHLKLTKATAERLRHCKDQEEIDRAVDLWGDRVMALYYTARDAMFYIDFHLRNQRRPKWEFRGPMHKSYLQFVEKVRQEITDEIEGAKEKIKREDLEKIYDEKHFPPEDTVGK
jgi:hypothetical protein